MTTSLSDHKAIKQRVSALEKEMQNSPLLFARVADYYMELGKLKKAQKILDKGLSDYPEYATGWVVMGNLHLMQDARADAIDAFKEALKLDPVNQYAHARCSDLAFELNNYDDYYYHIISLSLLDLMNGKVRQMERNEVLCRLAVKEGLYNIVDAHRVQPSQLVSALKSNQVIPRDLREQKSIDSIPLPQTFPTGEEDYGLYDNATITEDAEGESDEFDMIATEEVKPEDSGGIEAESISEVESLDEDQVMQAELNAIVENAEKGIQDEDEDEDEEVEASQLELADENLAQIDDEADAELEIEREFDDKADEPDGINDEELADLEDDEEELIFKEPVSSEFIEVPADEPDEIAVEISADEDLSESIARMEEDAEKANEEKQDVLEGDDDESYEVLQTEYEEDYIDPVDKVEQILEMASKSELFANNQDIIENTEGSDSFVQEIDSDDEPQIKVKLRDDAVFDNGFPLEVPEPSHQTHQQRSEDEARRLLAQIAKEVTESNLTDGNDDSSEDEEHKPRKIITRTRAELYAQQGDYQEAINMYQDLILLHPDNKSYRNRLEEIQAKWEIIQQQEKDEQ